MVINRRISRLTYAHRCIEGAAVQAYRDHGIGIAPGMKIQYVVTDARRYRVEPAWCAKSFDLLFYRELIDTAYTEISFAFSYGKQEPSGTWNESVLRIDAGSGENIISLLENPL